MLRIAITDVSAESRALLEQRIRALLESASEADTLVPRFSLTPLAIEEIRFYAAPDLCIIGPELIDRDLPLIRTVRHAMPQVPLVAALSRSQEAIAIVEQLARFGVDDTLHSDTRSDDFLRKVILLGRRMKKRKGGSLVLVDGGKGGLGVTSIVASFGDASAAKGTRTLLIDLDFETQDLSRFLQVRPFLNENLHLLLNGSRPITEEYVDQCFAPVWGEDDNLFLMAPCAEHEDLYDPRASYARVLVSMLEILDEKFEVVVIDVGSVRGSLLRTLYRVADTVLFLADSDPATVYAGVDRLTRARQWLAADASLVLVHNEASPRRGLPRMVVQDEFIRAAQLKRESVFPLPITFSERGSRWPGSGFTLWNLGSSKTGRAVQALSDHVISGELVAVEDSTLVLVLRAFRAMLHAVARLFGSLFPRGSSIPGTLKSETSLPSSSLQIPDLRGVGPMPDEGEAHTFIDSDLLVSVPVLLDSDRALSSVRSNDVPCHG